MTDSPTVPLVALTRAGIVESLHRGAVCVADATGRIRWSVGDPEWMVHPRSSMKPFQAIPFVRTGAAARAEASPADLAIVQASHAGEPMHTERLTALLERCGLSTDDLRCGVHAPFHAPSRRAVAPRFTVLHHNCSGNHLALAAAARALDPDTEPGTYCDPAHPVNVEVQAAFAALAGVREDAIGVGIDGCGVPAFALPLRGAAVAAARLADPSHAPEPYREALRTLFTAAVAYPEMIGGSDRYETLLMRAVPGLFCKPGAEGFLMLAIAPTGDAPGLGVAIKIEDGDQKEPMRARPAVANAVVAALCGVAIDVLPASERVIRTSTGEPVGHVQLEFTPRA